ncbi:MAG: nucleotide exchange factor GrpE [Gordonia sp. (in: high G+C Gram-positive bacteria)]|uniref:nucleotide exchange factor GrpE n=1 Tax=Gordonia sp. (in: high G+C Gram-positive bacteria) TaxID=84139 RepID=UPI0039E5F783
MTDSPDSGGDPTRLLADRVHDLTMLVAAQSQILAELADAERARAAEQADLPLLVELFALYTDAATCAAAPGPDAAAFGALRDGLERLITGRGGTVVVPAAGDDFSARTMEAVDTVPAGESPAGTVVELLRPGLVVGDRSVRAAMVVVAR